jgi:hypothetical protein
MTDDPNNLDLPVAPELSDLAAVPDVIGLMLPVSGSFQLICAKSDHLSFRGSDNITELKFANSLNPGDRCAICGRYLGVAQLNLPTEAGDLVTAGTPDSDDIMTLRLGGDEPEGYLHLNKAERFKLAEWLTASDH